MKYIATDTVTGKKSATKTYKAAKGAAVAYQGPSGRVRFHFYKDQLAAQKVLDVYGPLNEPGSLRMAELEIIED